MNEGLPVLHKDSVFQKRLEKGGRKEKKDVGRRSPGCDPGREGGGQISHQSRIPSHSQEI